VLAAGRKPTLIPKAGLWPDKIVEIEPQGTSGGKVVWEWHIWDHLIQDHDAKNANYGKPADHPELMYFNMGDTLPSPLSEDSMEILKAQGRARRNATAGNRGSDVYHFNAIKYNPELDQIVFSSPHLSEIFIIDHGTTTKEAAGHKGGRHGKGGDFLYRWGNRKTITVENLPTRNCLASMMFAGLKTANPALVMLLFLIMTFITEILQTIPPFMKSFHR
ncbi:MAG: aryl-sulfate sulfotransferase, partial [Ginsengibacter sp.]